MPVVAGVLLDHVYVDPPQRTGLTVAKTGVVEASQRRRLAAGCTLGVPDFEVVLPTSVVQRHQLTVFEVGVDPGGIAITGKDTAEPVPLDFGHVTNQAVQRQLRRGNRPLLTARVVEALTLQQQRGAVELKPPFKHLPLAKNELRFLTTRILKLVNHEAIVALCAARSLGTVL